MAEQPVPGMNHPAWTLGHLALAADYALKLLGRDSQLDPDWARLFSPGQEPTGNRSDYPGKTALIEAWTEARSALLHALREQGADVLDKPNPIEALRDHLPTVADQMAYMLTGHEAEHLGQIAVWRRAAGFERILR